MRELAKKQKTIKQKKNNKKKQKIEPNGRVGGVTKSNNVIEKAGVE
jgi:hypothetical protein